MSEQPPRAYRFDDPTFLGGPRGSWRIRDGVHEVLKDGVWTPSERRPTVTPNPENKPAAPEARPFDVTKDRLVCVMGGCFPGPGHHGPLAGIRKDTLIPAVFNTAPLEPPAEGDPFSVQDHPTLMMVDVVVGTRDEIAADAAGKLGAACRHFDEHHKIWPGAIERLQEALEARKIPPGSTPLLWTYAQGPYADPGAKALEDARVRAEGAEAGVPRYRQAPWVRQLLRNLVWAFRHSPLSQQASGLDYSKVASGLDVVRALRDMLTVWLEDEDARREIQAVRPTATAAAPPP